MKILVHSLKPILNLVLSVKIFLLTLLFQLKASGSTNINPIITIDSTEQPIFVSNRSKYGYNERLALQKTQLNFILKGKISVPTANRPHTLPAKYSPCWVYIIRVQMKRFSKAKVPLSAWNLWLDSKYVVMYCLRLTNATLNPIHGFQAGWDPGCLGLSSYSKQQINILHLFGCDR